MKKILPLMLLALAVAAVCNAAPVKPAAPSIVVRPALAATQPGANQHYNAFAYGASPDSTSSNPGTVNLYKIAGACPATTVLSAFTLLSSGNPPSATSASPIYDTAVASGQTNSYVVTAVIGGIESNPSSCVTGKTPTFQPTSLTITSQ